MSHSRLSRTLAPLRRLPRVRLRLKVMAGVVAVTLVALAAFDLAAVATMRRYLLAQTDSSLQSALTLTVPKVGSLLSSQPPVRVAGNPRPVQVRLGPTSPGSKFPSFPGAFDMVFLPIHGNQVILQIAATGGAGGASWIHLPPGASRQLVAQRGPHTVAIGRMGVPLRVRSALVKGGSLVVGTSLDQVTKTIDQVELIITLGSIAVVLLIGLGVFAVVRRGLRPIEAMVAAADRITGGDLTDRVAPYDPQSEVGRLGAALNDMLARIEAEAREREASQLQTRRFFADASHELRTPLASLRANAELYQQGALRGPDEVGEVMGRIALETRRMGRLVDDMLRLARLGQHPGQSREPVELTAVLTGCAERARIADPARTWQVRIADDLTVVGDEELLRRAVDNLLMNVLVHTPGDTAGTISASAAGGGITIEVSDDGPGVPPGQLPHIFERFYRAGARSAHSGSGLGLAIAAEIASAHGGTAAAEPGSPHGLRITLTLPVRSGRHCARELAASVS